MQDVYLTEIDLPSIGVKKGDILPVAYNNAMYARAINEFYKKKENRVVIKMIPKTELGSRLDNEKKLLEENEELRTKLEVAEEKIKKLEQIMDFNCDPNNVISLKTKGGRPRIIRF